MDQSVGGWSMQETTQREQCSESREQKDGRRGGKSQTEGKDEEKCIYSRKAGSNPVQRMRTSEIR